VIFVRDCLCGVRFVIAFFGFVFVFGIVLVCVVCSCFVLFFVFCFVLSCVCVGVWLDAYCVWFSIKLCERLYSAV